MYALYVNDKFRMILSDLKTLKDMGFILAVRGYKVAYKEVK